MINSMFMIYRRKSTIDSNYFLRFLSRKIIEPISFKLKKKSENFKLIILNTFWNFDIFGGTRENCFALIQYI